MTKIESTEFLDLLLSGARLIDVRAPVEFAEGSIPGSVNLPILTDDERQQVGVTYKTDGPQAAIELGHRLVSGATRKAREDSWLQEIARHPEAVILCFRGGLRSQTAQAWLSERGVRRPLIAGGYKAMRRFLLQALEKEPTRRRFRVVRGPTGSGKTKFLASSGKPYLDLEAHARHRGSAFGALEVPQPTQIDFENAVALTLLRLPVDEEILIESESRMIGSRTVPESLFRRMQESPQMLLDVDLETRVENILHDYIEDSSLIKAGDPTRFDEFASAINAISRRLGGTRSAEILEDLKASREEFLTSRTIASNRTWIRKLLVWYYDPLYARSVIK